MNVEKQQTLKSYAAIEDVVDAPEALTYQSEESLSNHRRFFSIILDSFKQFPETQ